MNYARQRRWNAWLEKIATTPRNFAACAQEVGERSLTEARAELHPLLREAALNQLKKRSEFTQAFQQALERCVARRLATWQPGILTVYRFDAHRPRPGQSWDGSLHLLVKVARRSRSLGDLVTRLDRGLLAWLQGLGWTRFYQRQTILEVQQVTPLEIRRGLGYGAMFQAVYTKPVRIWPPTASRSST